MAYAQSRIMEQKGSIRAERMRARANAVCCESESDVRNVKVDEDKGTGGLCDDERAINRN